MREMIFADGETDMTKPTGVFHDFANTPKINAYAEN